MHFFAELRALQSSEYHPLTALFYYSIFLSLASRFTPQFGKLRGKSPDRAPFFPMTVLYRLHAARARFPDFNLVSRRSTEAKVITLGIPGTPYQAGLLPSRYYVPGIPHVAFAGIVGYA